MELEKYSDANKKSQNILDNKPNAFVESATWYLGMCYILIDERDKAADQFEILANREGYYQNNAKNILKRIN